MKQLTAGVAMLATLAACSSPPPDRASSTLGSVVPPSAITFEGPSGEPIALKNLPATRIVSTMQSATEWIVALGAESLLVARTDYDRQSSLADLPTIGGGSEPSAELLASLNPDLVIGWRNRGSADMQRALTPFGIPVISMETTDTADVFLNLARIGLLVGRAGRADSLATALRTELRAAATLCDGGATESAMIVVWSDPPMTAGAGTWLDQLLGAACLRNAFADVRAPWSTISMEAITVRQPRW
ncbi:MAG: helical backbone metal receptor, partial [Gemmatimonadales bacterium]